jgi:hypothetical protein
LYENRAMKTFEIALRRRSGEEGEWWRGEFN